VLSKAQLEAGLRIGESLNIARFVLSGDSFVQPSVPAPHEPFETANGGSEFQATIQKAGGNLYGVLPFASNDGNGFSRDVLAWFILRPTLTSTPSLTANIVAQGYVLPPDGDSLI
jgi:hypothetical protein